MRIVARLFVGTTAYDKVSPNGSAPWQSSSLIATPLLFEP
jgi:hypothetical protein